MGLLCDGSTILRFYYAIRPLRDGSTIALYRRRQPATTTTQEWKGNDNQLPHNYPGTERQGQPGTTTTQEQKKGSSDIDNWIREARESTISFWSDHVEQLLLYIRDKLFEIFRKRHKGVMELEEIQLTQNSLHEMVLAFTELPNNTSDLEMLEVVMNRYKKEVVHPIQNLLGGELVHVLLIQIQKLKLDTETAIELNQILKANEINFAMLAALPAFSLSLILLLFATRDSPPPDRVRGRNCIMKDMYGRIVAYKSIQLSGVAPKGFYRVIVDEVIRDDVQLFMEGGTLGDISSGEIVIWYKSLTCFG
ncbi:hypothetical protein GIB67_011314 [Kingdonia uniflora]|uniref:Uncharacterized protein n=1 Tax=Kingdonia uniflora TaxID=39325 RepID=A0A7J7MNN5_9MAGN|nr:hypothetical protein GIB67_011314 [Kingdonia uniflora]